MEENQDYKFHFVTYDFPSVPAEDGSLVILPLRTADEIITEHLKGKIACTPIPADDAYSDNSPEESLTTFISQDSKSRLDTFIENLTYESETIFFANGQQGMLTIFSLNLPEHSISKYFPASSGALATAKSGAILFPLLALTVVISEYMEDPVLAGASKVILAGYGLYFGFMFTHNYFNAIPAYLYDWYKRALDNKVRDYMVELLSEGKKKMFLESRYTEFSAQNVLKHIKETDIGLSFHQNEVLLQLIDSYMTDLTKRKFKGGIEYPYFGKKPLNYPAQNMIWLIMHPALSAASSAARSVHLTPLFVIVFQTAVHYVVQDFYQGNHLSQVYATDLCQNISQPYPQYQFYIERSCELTKNTALDYPILSSYATYKCAQYAVWLSSTLLGYTLGRVYKSKVN